MIAIVRKTAKRAVAVSGWDVRRATPVSDMYSCLTYFAAKAGATTLIDAGANTGQFSRCVRDAGWRGKIVSFEPLSAAHAALILQASRVAGWEIAPRMALGRERATCEINIAANSQSSSLLPMSEIIRAGGDNLNYVGTETVDVMPLSEWILGRPHSERYVLKLDVQGFEREVIDGAGAYLERCPVVHTEMSLQEHYIGEALFPEVSLMLTDRGYRCVGIRPGYFDPASREILQVDGTFVR